MTYPTSTTTRSGYRAAKLSEANDAIGAARDAMNAATVGSKAWRTAAEDLDWWQGRKAFVAAMPVEG